MDSQFFQELVTKYLDGTANAEEKAVVEGYYEKLSIKNQYTLTEEQKQRLDRAIFGEPQPQQETETVSEVPVRMLHPKRRTWIRAAAAVLILFSLGAASWFAFTGKNRKDQNFAALPQNERFKNDINPAAKGATLTTETGETIALDSTANGELQTAHATLTKENASVAYTGTSTNQVYYHTIATNKGNEYHLTLADGTEVWLDAMSSIHFPTAFPGTERIVEVTGQAYFEVAKDKTRPFKVMAGGVETKVLGTHFNVNSYAATKVTLLEGSVQVRKIKTANSNSQDNTTAGLSPGQILIPGQQAMLTAGRLQLNKAPDLDETMAWHTGKFRFKRASIEEIMEQISRWYDIEVVYNGKVSETFVARIERNVPVSKLLSLLEMTKQVAFTIEGNKVTVFKPHL